MPKIAQELGAAQVAKLKEPGLHAVGGVAGLSLQISPSGARSWILRATIGERRRDIGLGGFPTVSLADARLRAREARQAIWSGSDPVEAKRAAKAALIASQAKAITFEEAARRAHRARAAGFKSEKHRADWLSSLERFAFPAIGRMQVSMIEVGHVQQVLEPIWADRTETATRLRQRIESVLSWATVSGFRDGSNPARWADNLKELMPAPAKIRKRAHHPALPWQDVPGFLADLGKRDGVAARCLEFIILTAARSGEARLAVWSEFDLAAKLWRVPGDRMKGGKVHTVPLSDFVVRLLGNLPRAGDYVFTAPRGGALSDMSISAVCRRMGVEAVPHGFRSSFKDWCRNNTRFADEVSELQLAHVNSDATRAAYARDELLQPRRELMRQWESFCTQTKRQAR
jgi:integrase